MKAVQLIGIVAIAASITFSSCSVEKRRYRKGYNVNKDKKDDKVDAKASKTTTEPVKPAEPVVVNTPVEKTTAPAATTKVETPAPAYTGDKKINTEYNFKVVQGPRPDKKGKKKYPMNFH